MNRLKELREERGYSTRGIETKLDISYAVINYYENEKRDPSTASLKKLADFFEVSIDYLLCYSGCYVYAAYELDKFTFKIRDDYYKELKDNDFIYFKNDKRYINLNKLLGLPEGDVLPLVIEFARIRKMDALFDKKNPTINDIKDLKKEIIDIELNKSFIEILKDAVK